LAQPRPATARLDQFTSPQLNRKLGAAPAITATGHHQSRN
jgi:hypothetical protein